MATPDRSEAIARMFEISDYRPMDQAYRNLPAATFLIRPGLDPTNGADVEVPGIVVHAKSQLNSFEIVRLNMPLFVGDVIKTSPTTTIGIELLIGGRIGIKPGTCVKIINEGEAALLDGTHWQKIVLKSGGLWAKFNKQEKPLTVQTRGGVMGIKG